MMHCALVAVAQTYRKIRAPKFILCCVDRRLQPKPQRNLFNTIAAFTVK